MNTYPRLCLLGLSFIFAYVLYHVGAFDWMHATFSGYGYLSVFLGGLLFSFGFTTPFGIAIFMEMGPEVHPLLAAPIAGVGAFLSDLLIFDILRFSTFKSELKRLRASHAFVWMHDLIFQEELSMRIRKWMLWSFAGIIIASPLPDELGVSLISGISKIRPKQFGIICYCFNTIGIFIMLVISRLP